MHIQQGDSAKYVQDQVGHASINSTFDVYGHIMPETRRESAVKLERAIFGGNASVRRLLEGEPDKVNRRVPIEGRIY
jgi:hypothetical protein